MAQNYVFTITTGRSGTAYLTALVKANVPDAETYHEISSYLSIGVESPDLSDITMFNTLGNSDKVRSFWLRKMSKINRSEHSVYAETSHLLAKSGLIENIELLGRSASINIIDLRRDAGDTLMSFVARNDFRSNGNALLFYLQPNYKKNLLTPKKIFPAVHWAAWYIAEMRSRASFYERYLRTLDNVNFIRVDLSDIATPEGAAALLRKLGIGNAEGRTILPARQNASPSLYTISKQEEGVLRDIGEQVEAMDTDSIGLEAFTSGKSFEQMRPS